MNLLPQLIQIYGILLNIPITHKWRIENNEIYAKIRDEISNLTGVEAEAVQQFCEMVSHASKQNGYH